MCFSSSASFGISAVLLVGGIATYKQTKNISQVPFAMIPFIFSIQQFCEGLLWLSLTKPEFAGFERGSTYIFLILAQGLWPLWVPYSIYKIEENPDRKKVLKLFLISGLIVSVYLMYSLTIYPAKASISTFHIQYDLARPHSNIFTGVFYFIATIIPPFISSIKKMMIISLFGLASFLITILFYPEHIISIWCFFAAGISIGVILVLRKKTFSLNSYKPI
ncbi:MAG: DUF6629 family protein [Bacteroidia bacterium]